MYSLQSHLRQMMDRNASDLFLTEGRPPSMRINGALTSLTGEASSREELQSFLDRVLGTAQHETFERTGGVDAGVTITNLGRFRLHFFLQRGLLSVVIRAVPSGQLSFEQLMLPAAVRSLAEQPRGLVLVTGATGSGKSTTLAAMVHHINQHFSKHIVTLEDPIEFVHEDIKSIVTQREVGNDARDFSSALKHVVRQSPDVILIGEMRDAESMNIALSAALTGHLVLSSLHTIDATQTLQRILSYYPEHLRTQVCMDLSLCLQGIIAQRLVPRSDGEGRVAAIELLLGTPSVRKLLREQRVDELYEAISTGEGMQTFSRALVKLYEQNVISYDVGASYANNPDEFKLNAQGMERGTSAFVAELENLPSVGQLDMRTLLSIAVRHGASDIHLVAGSPGIFRVHGRLRRIKTDALSPSDVRRLLYSLLSYSQRERFELDRELDFALTVSSGHRFRVNAHYQRGSVGVALRLIPNALPNASALRIPTSVLDLCHRTQGLVLVTGPTGSGKSTTLATLIDAINEARECHIITIEDPIEFVHTNKRATVEQREVGDDTKSFAAALKYILRQDPDVVLVGEMRDPETIAAALTAAETGHLVFATLHTNDAPQTVDRIVDVFPPFQQTQVRVQLASALLAIVAQRLLPRSDGTGRTAAFEILTATPAIRTLIRDSKTHQIANAMETGRVDGMITLDRALSDLTREGLVTVEEAARYARNAAGFRTMLQDPSLAGIPGAINTDPGKNTSRSGRS